MQTAIGTTNGRPGTTYYQRGRMHRHQPGNRQQKEKKAAAGRNRIVIGGNGENSPRYPRLLYGEPRGRKNQPYDKGEF